MKATTVLACVLAACAAAFAATMAASDSDMFWHLESGEWMLDHRAMLDRDIWSFTREGTPYASGEWLGEVVLAVAYRGLGWLGVDLLRAALVGCAAFFAARVTLRVQAHPGWAAGPILIALLVSKITWADRPALFTLALTPLVLDLVLAAVLERRVRRLVLVPPLLLLWVNLHGAFPVALAIVAVGTLEVFAARSRGLRLPFAATLFASLAVTQLNPAGASALVSSAAYAATPAAFVVEERPPDVLAGAGLLFAMLLVASFASLLLLGPRVGRASGTLILWPALVVAFGVLGLSAQRRMPLACFVLAPLVAWAVPLVWGRLPAHAPRLPAAAGAIVVAAIAASTVAVSIAAAPRAPDLSLYPVAAIDPLRARPGNLLNEYDWGGYLIWTLPEHKTFIDGRGALLFEPDVRDEFERLVRVRPGYRDALRARDLRLALLRRERPLVEALREDGWRTVAGDPRFILLERP